MNDCQSRLLPASQVSSQQQAQERTRVLQAYDILDTPPEEAFDKITRLAAQMFQVAISLVTFIDAERQWFKSHHGTDLHETDLSASFCLCAVQDGCTLVVPNALEDPRFFNNPSVTAGLELRYYVGAPLITPEGVALGTLCLIDTVPRQRPSTAQISMLETLASVIVDEMRLRRSLAEQKTIEIRLQNLLQSKNVLLKEIHHRVKNNLQLVSSMLNIHSRQLSDKQAKAALQESRARIGVIANVHELMYASQTTSQAHKLHTTRPQTANQQITNQEAGNQEAVNQGAVNQEAGNQASNDETTAEDHVELATLLTELANNVMRLAPQTVALELTLTPCQLDVHRAIPLSLIVNELLTNALKYAFTDPETTPQQPSISLSTSIRQDSPYLDASSDTSSDTSACLCVSVMDNGVGLPADTDLNNVTSLGFTVVSTLSQQIGGHLYWRNREPSGLDVSILLPLMYFH